MSARVCAPHQKMESCTGPVSAAEGVAEPPPQAVSAAAGTASPAAANACRRVKPCGVCSNMDRLRLRRGSSDRRLGRTQPRRLAYDQCRGKGLSGTYLVAQEKTDRGAPRDLGRHGDGGQGRTGTPAEGDVIDTYHAHPVWYRNPERRQAFDQPDGHE